MAEQAFYDTLAPHAISTELAPAVERLGLTDNCRELAEQGWTVLRQVADPDFNEHLRTTIVDLTEGRPGANMLLHKHPVFAQAVMMPKLLAMAEFSVGRGFLLSQVAASVRKKDSPTIGLHADHNWLPAPFPAHNMLLTACWACDGYSHAGGATVIIPGSNLLMRHPNESEIHTLDEAVTVTCEPGDVPIWDGNLWHSNAPKTTPGERVVCHITYTRLMMRPVEDYREFCADLIAEHGPVMSQLMGCEDMLMSSTGADYSKLRQTFNNAKR